MLSATGFCPLPIWASGQQETGCLRCWTCPKQAIICLETFALAHTKSECTLLGQNHSLNSVFIYYAANIWTIVFADKTQQWCLFFRAAAYQFSLLLVKWLSPVSWWVCSSQSSSGKLWYLLSLALPQKGLTQRKSSARLIGCYSNTFSYWICLQSVHPMPGRLFEHLSCLTTETTCPGQSGSC